MSTEKPANICIIGPGAVGLFLAVRFAASHNVWLAVRSDHCPQLEGQTLQISGGLAAAAGPDKITLLTAAEFESLPPDVAFWICVKAFDLDTVVESLLPVLTDRTPVVVLPNGLGVFMQAALLIGRRAPLLRVCPSFGVQRISPVETVLAGAIRLSASGLPEHRAELDRTRELLTEIADSVSIEKDVATAEWKKALINLAVNPICTIVNGRNGALIEDSGLRQLASAVLREVRSVAAAEGFDLSQITDEVFFEGLEAHARNVNSSLADLRVGCRTELEYLYSRFLRIADDNGTDVPLSRALWALCRRIERDAVSPAPAWPHPQSGRL